jgi:hypothetical protein
MSRLRESDEPTAARGKRVFLLAILSGGAVVAVLVCAGCGIGGYFLFFSAPAVAGRWEFTNQALTSSGVSIDFRPNGTGAIQGRNLDVEFDYTVSRDAVPTLEWRIKRTGMRTIHAHANLEIKVNNMVVVGAPMERFRVTHFNDTLFLANENGAPQFTLRRVR